MEWWGFRWGMNNEMLSHMKELGNRSVMFQPPAHVKLMNFVGGSCETRRDALVLSIRKILNSFGRLVLDPETELPDPDWLKYDGSESSLRIETNPQAMFTPPFEMEEIAPLACFMWLHLDGAKPSLRDRSSGSYAITGNLLPESPEEIEEMVVRTTEAAPAPRKWFDYHIQNN